MNMTEVKFNLVYVKFNLVRYEAYKKGQKLIISVNAANLENIIHSAILLNII